MTDPVGATLAVLALAGLFTVCVNCFDFVQHGRSLGKDFALLEGQFEVFGKVSLPGVKPQAL